MNDNLRVEGRAADMISRNTNLVPVISTEMNSDTSDKYTSYNNKVKIHLVYGVILTTLFAFSVYKATKDKITKDVITSLIATCFAISIFIVIFVICEIILCLCQVLVFNHWFDLTSTLSHHLVPNTASIVILACAVLTFLGQIFILQRCPLHYIWDCGPHVYVASMVFSFLLLRSVTSERRTNESPVFSLNDLKGLDYGTGMAYSYYYGYLRLVLPSSGTTSKGIVEKIENFEDTHNVSFPIHKLFILIPSSGYIPPNLKEMSDQWMESAKELEEERRNRAGNIRRTYHNNVYKIYPGGRKSGADPIYVVAEGASPLLTFYESELDTKDLCELIYYHDYKPDGTKVNVAKIILERIFQMTHT